MHTMQEEAAWAVLEALGGQGGECLCLAIALGINILPDKVGRLPCRVSMPRYWIAKHAIYDKMLY